MKFNFDGMKNFTKAQFVDAVNMAASTDDFTHIFDNIRRMAFETAKNADELRAALADGRLTEHQVDDHVANYTVKQTFLLTVMGKISEGKFNDLTDALQMWHDTRNPDHADMSSDVSSVPSLN